MAFGGLEHLFYPTCRSNVVVFDQDRIGQGITVIVASAMQHSELFRQAHIRRGLARAGDAGVGALCLGNKARGFGRDAGQTARIVQSHTFSRKDRGRRAFDLHQCRARFGGFPIPDARCDLKRRIDQAKGQSGDLHA